jgi:hypothetical protein
MKIVVVVSKHYSFLQIFYTLYKASVETACGNKMAEIWATSHTTL